MGFGLQLGRFTSHGAATVVISIWVVCNLLLPTHFWLFKYNTLQDKADVPFNLGSNPDTLNSKVIFKCCCVFLKVACLLSYAMTALTMCRWTWTKLSHTWVRRYLCLDKFETIHKVSGVVGWLELLTVTALYLVNWGKLCSYYRKGNEDHNFCADFYSEIMITGYLLTFFHTVIVCFSLRAVRRKRYEWFYWSHHLFIAIFLLSILHPIDWRHRRGGKERLQTWPVMIGPVTLYFFDRLMVMVTQTWTHCLKLTLIASPRTILLKLYAPRGYLKSRPGMVCWLNVPAVSWLNWHPYSIAHTDDSGCVYLMISCTEHGWTDQLWRALAMATFTVPFRNLAEEFDDQEGEDVSSQVVRQMTHAFNHSAVPTSKETKVSFLVTASHMAGKPLSMFSDTDLENTGRTSYASSVLHITSTPVPSRPPGTQFGTKQGDGRKFELLPSVSDSDAEYDFEVSPSKKERPSRPPNRKEQQQVSDATPRVIGKNKLMWASDGEIDGEKAQLQQTPPPMEVGTQTTPRTPPSTSGGGTSIGKTVMRESSLQQIRSLAKVGGLNTSAATDIWQKSASAEDIATGLWQIRQAWIAAYGVADPKKVKVTPSFVDALSMSEFDRAVWLGNLDLVRRLTKWPGDFGLSGPFTAGVTEAAHFDHSIMLGAGSGILPFISHVKQFLNVKCPLKGDHPTRTTERSPVYTGAGFYIRRSQYLAEAIEYGPRWAFGCYLYIMSEFILGVGALAMAVNRSIELQTLGSWMEGFFMWSDWIRLIAFVCHKVCVHVAFGWNPKGAKRRGVDRIGAGSLTWFLVDWGLIILSLSVLVVNLIATSSSLDVRAGGIMFALQWRHVCTLTSVGGYFCHFRQVEIPGIGTASFVFVATFLCSIFRLLRVWSQTPRLLSGGVPIPGVPEWEADLLENQPAAMRLSTIDMVWVVRSPQWVEALLPELEDAITRRSPQGRSPFTCQIFITDLELVAGLKPDVFYGSPMRQYIQYGRPDLAKVAMDICDSRMTSLGRGAAAGFFISGPPAFQRDAKAAYLAAIEHVLKNTDGCGGNFSYHPEKFG